MQTGRKSYQKAAQDATKEWAKNGISVLRTKNGARLTIDGYVPMVIRAEQKRASIVAQEGELDAYGIDLVEMSSHAGSRPSHVPFQGRIYSRSGTSDRYPPLSTTGYGAVDGMVTGINCRHQMYPYIEGVSGKRFEPYDAEESKQKYLESQQQRHLEREIRRAKREKRALENTGADALEVKRANGKIRKRQAALRAFVEKTGRTRRYEREGIFVDEGYNRIKINGSNEILNQAAKQDLKKIPVYSSSLEITRCVKSGELSLSLNQEHYEKHKIGTKQYDAYRLSRHERGWGTQSRLTITPEVAQKLIYEYTGRGIVRGTRSGKPMMIEDISTESIVGYYVENGIEYITTKARIVYAKKSAHIYPIKGDSFD